MEGQKKGDCGHIMASVDPHGICVRCRECDLVNAPCSVYVAMTSVQRESALLACARRRRHLQRRKERAGSVCSSSSKQSSGSVDRPTPEPPVTGRGGTVAAPAKGGGSKTVVLRPRTAAQLIPPRRRATPALRFLPGPLATASRWPGTLGHPTYVGRWPGKRLTAGAD